MARELDYKWDDSWNNGNQWVAISGEDFPDGEAELFKLWLDSMAFELGDRHVRAWVKKMNYSQKVGVFFRFMDWEPKDEVDDGAR